MNPEFLSGEASASPAVEPLLEVSRRLFARGIGSGALAARNGPRVTTHAAVPFEMLTAADFVEVADYDPHLDRLMLLGTRPPHAHAGMVQLVFRAKKEIGALILVEARTDGLAMAKKGRTPLENALGILEALRGSDAIGWGSHVLVVGRTPQEALARAEAVLA